MLTHRPVKLLAIETSHQRGSVALLEDGSLVAEATLPEGLPTTRSLHPTIKSLMEDAGWSALDVRVVATTIGPGSFTGLRIAVATAKTFAYLTGADAVGLDTLEVIVHQIPASYHEVHLAVDAQRGEVVAGSFRLDSSGKVRTITRAHLVRFEDWVRSLPEGAFIGGPALARYAVPEDHAVAVLPRELWFPQASAVGQLGWLRWQEGRADNVWTLAPRYARLSYAEEKIS